MSADRETNHDMTNTDITLLLAEAADGVEIGIAPTQAVIRGGRRRRARRWTVATAAALAIVGTTGTVALAGLPGGGDGHRGAPVATHPPTSVAPRLGGPQSTLLASGTEDGNYWEVSIDVWAAPHNAAEAQTQLAVMTQYGEFPGDVRNASDLIGKGAYFVHMLYGDRNSLVIHQTLPKGEKQTGTDLVSGASGLKSSSEPARLVIGRIAKTAQQVTCTWKDGTNTVLHRVSADAYVNRVLPQGIHSAEGSSDNWFVCLAPKGTSYDKAEVTG